MRLTLRTRVVLAAGAAILLAVIVVAVAVSVLVERQLRSSSRWFEEKHRVLEKNSTGNFCEGGGEVMRPIWWFGLLFMAETTLKQIQFRY